ncbi:hypothetical protein [Duganella violaceipulchra]|uniref:Uncharacterized protein n=1 Tax=Duganella violaceipulchra TaxID=2849652 RepID=A0AA41H6X4_9BURK|nr:hypothetical protein [Duganella violaceicalia]MBV6321569.1 hypothetical protein [Duganella violaceicalia]MCP2008172.1 hypothetical protein [Duganella violaceicalia]
MRFEQGKVNQLFQQRKLMRNWSGFRPKENHRGLIMGTALLADAAGIFIVGMTLQIELRVATVVGDCLMTFSIFQRMGSHRQRIYQLEVCPRDKLSHNGVPAIYGPHEHMPNEEVYAVSETSVDCDNWQGSFSWFLSRTNIESFVLEQPC